METMSLGNEEDIKLDFEPAKAICRCCLMTERRMHNAVMFEAFFKDLAGINVTESDGLPQWLCYECATLLQKSVRFKHKVLRAHTMLYEYLTRCAPFPIEAQDEELSKYASPHLSTTSVLTIDIVGKGRAGYHQVLEHEKQVQSSGLDDIDIQLITKMEDDIVKEENGFSDYEDNITLEEFRSVATKMTEDDIASLLQEAAPVQIKEEPPAKRKKTREVKVKKKKKEIKLFQGYTVEMTPGGSLRTAEPLNLEQTPHGSIRREKFPPVPMLLGALEKVAAADVEEEDIEETLSQHGAHINRWLLGTAPSNSPPTIPPAPSSPEPGPSGVASRVEHQTPARGSDMDSDYDDVFDTNLDFTCSRIERDIPDDTAEYGVQLQQAIEEMEEAMDRCQDDLLGGNNVFNWSEKFSTFTGTRGAFVGTPGPTKDFPEVDSAFTAIWDVEIMSRIAEETNRYAKQVIQARVLSRKSRLQYWTPTNVEELYRLFAVFIFMGMDPRTKQSEYWMTSTVLAMPGFRKLMPFNRFILLTKFLHFVDNNDASQNALRSEGKFLSPKLYKLSPVIYHLNKRFSELYSLEENLSIDESLTLFKGRLSWIQAIRSKSARFGMKSFELCESRTGYMYRFHIYTGQSHTTNVDSDVVSIGSDLGGKTTKIVLELIEGLERKGHCLTMDNFYNSPALARHLKSKGIDCLGTLRANRKHVPEAINKLKKNVARGTIVAQHSGDVSVVAWKDVKIVNMISTFHDKTGEGTRAGKSLQKPTSVRDYNVSMGGIDLKDQMLSMYLMERKRCLKWYVKLFKRLLNVSVLNSYIMCNKSRESSPELNLEAIDHRTYRYELAERLSRIGRVEISRPVPADDINVTRLRRDVSHNPVMSRGRKMNRRRCARCGAKGIEKRVLSACTVCNVGLCFGTECWKDYHSLENLNETTPEVGMTVETKSSIRKPIELDPTKIRIVTLNPEEQIKQREEESKAGLKFPFQCNLCHKGFNFESKLQNHMSKHSPSRGPYECKLCRMHLPTSYSFNVHSLIHNRRYECVACARRMIDRASIIDHYRTQHEGFLTLFTCHLCGKVSNDQIDEVEPQPLELINVRAEKALTKRRMNAMSAEVRKEFVCHKRHAELQRVLLPEAPPREKQTRNNKTHRGHMRNHHSGDRPKCDQCGKTFINKDSLVEHQQIHQGIKNYECAICNKRFRTRTQIKHHQLAHTDVKDYYCVECDVRFKSAHSLRQHLQKSLKHRDKQSLKFSCPRCPARFPSARALAAHGSVQHDGVRAHVCAECGAALASRSSLSKHTHAVHRGVRPPPRHVCDTCGKAFRGKSVLTNHVRTHTGEKPFECGECGRKFTQRTAMRTHVKLVHLKLRKSAKVKPEVPLEAQSPKLDVFKPEPLLEPWRQPCDVYFHVTAGP